MKKLIPIFLVTTVLAGLGACEPNATASERPTEVLNTRSGSSSNFEGRWKPTTNMEAVGLLIEKSGSNYVVTQGGKKYVGTLDGDILVVNVPFMDVKALIDSEGQLIADGKTYVRVNE